MAASTVDPMTAELSSIHDAALVARIVDMVYWMRLAFTRFSEWEERNASIYLREFLGTAAMGTDRCDAAVLRALRTDGYVYQSLLELHVQLDRTRGLLWRVSTGSETWKRVGESITRFDGLLAEHARRVANERPPTPTPTPTPAYEVEERWTKRVRRNWLRDPDPMTALPPRCVSPLALEQDWRLDGDSTDDIGTIWT